jgi:hypothetical protein
MSIGIGYYLAKKREKRVGKPAKPSGIESSVISFFALLISFTLASASNFHKERLGLIHQQASCLAQLYRGSLDQPDSIRQSVNIFLLRHIAIQTESRNINENINDSMLQQVGSNNLLFLAEMKKQGQLQNILPAFNALTSQTYKLIYAYDERIPPLVMFLLIITSLLIAVLIGFLNRSNEERHYLASFIYFLLVVLTVQAIRDLDNPNAGLVKPSYENLESVREMILLGK